MPLACVPHELRNIVPTCSQEPDGIWNPTVVENHFCRLLTKPKGNASLDKFSLEVQKILPRKSRPTGCELASNDLPRYLRGCANFPRLSDGLNKSRLSETHAPGHNEPPRAPHGCEAYHGTACAGPL